MDHVRTTDTAQGETPCSFSSSKNGELPMNANTTRLMLGITATAIATSLVMGCNKTPESSPEPQVAPVSMDTQTTDSTVTSNVKSALMADATVKDFDLQVETRTGTVKLEGAVDTQAQIDQAISVARGVKGVSAVETGITLKGATTSLGTKIDDTNVTGRVKAALLADPDVKSFDISVATTNGEVQLTGVVDNQGQIDQATKIARAAEGASSIKSDLRIKQ
jgi:hyperosmotically inducible protein